MQISGISRSSFRRRGLTFVLGLCLLSLNPALAANEVLKWNEVAGRAAFVSGLVINGLFEGRINALAHIAMHDALNIVDREYRGYVLNLPVSLRHASPDAAIATAAYVVLVNQFEQLPPFGFPSQKALFDAAYASSMRAIPDGPAKTLGIVVGKAAAAAALAKRVNDGWNKQTVLDFNYPQSTTPGVWRFAPPLNFAFMPTWGSIPPFVLRSAAQFRPGPPHPLASKEYARDVNEIKRLGGDGSTTPSARTPDETEIALFWLEDSIFGWNRMARTVAAARRLNKWESARLFALLNITLSDAYIASFSTKYHYKFWRPITAIREADTDGNPDTAADPLWTPLTITPPQPDYESGHSIAGGAAAQLFKRFFGTDHIAFRHCSTTLPAGQTCDDPVPVTRFYTSFTQAAEENAISRILVGIHFRKAVEEGVAHGRKIADYVFENSLRPTH